MPSTTKVNPSVVMLYLITFILSLNSCATVSLPALENRTLRLSKDKPELVYQYEACVRKFLGACTKKEMRIDRYDLADPHMRNSLIDMGFVFKVREKP